MCDYVYGGRSKMIGSSLSEAENNCNAMETCEMFYENIKLSTRRFMTTSAINANTKQIKVI